MVAVPADAPRTTPLFTEAMLGLLLFQVTSVFGLPLTRATTVRSWPISRANSVLGSRATLMFSAGGLGEEQAVIKKTSKLGQRLRMPKAYPVGRFGL